MKNESLIEKAKKFQKIKKSKHGEYTKELLELYVAYVNNEVSMTQMCGALGEKSSGNILYRGLVVFKEAFRRGELKIKIK